MKKSEFKSFLKKIISEAKLFEANIQDPSKNEMLQFLGKTYGREEGFKDDAEIAMYWFANFFHGGQTSNLYSVLSTSRFSPGPSARGPQPDSMEQMMYDDLVMQYAPNSEEGEEIQRERNSLNENDAPIDLNSPDANVLYMLMLDIANMSDPSFRVILALKKGIDRRVTDQSDKEKLIQVFNKEFGGSHIKAGNTAWNYYRQENLQEGDEGDAVNDMWAGSDDDLEAHGYKEPKNSHANKQKSKQFFGGNIQKKPAKTVQDIDWTRIKDKINRDTLRENQNDIRVDYGISGTKSLEPSYHQTPEEAWNSVKTFIQNASKTKVLTLFPNGLKTETLPNGMVIRTKEGKAIAMAVIHQGN